MATKRELIAPHGDERFVCRDQRGRFTADQVDVDRSLVQDSRRDAKAVEVVRVARASDRR